MRLYRNEMLTRQGRFENKERDDRRFRQPGRLSDQPLLDLLRIEDALDVQAVDAWGLAGAMSGAADLSKPARGVDHVRGCAVLNLAPRGHAVDCRQDDRQRG